MYSDQNNFEIHTKEWHGLDCTIATFQTGEFEIEIFSQDCPNEKQNAHKHLIIEHKILNSKDEEFKAETMSLKQKGFKTETAFAKLLGLDGNPYEELLKLEI